MRRLVASILLVLSGCSGLEDHKQTGKFSTSSFTLKHNGKVHTVLEGPHGLVKIDERKAP